MLTLRQLLESAQVVENNQTLIITSIELKPSVFKFLCYADQYLRHYNIGTIYAESEYGDEISLQEGLDDVHTGVVGKLSISKTAAFPVFFLEKTFIKLIKASTILQPVYHLIFIAEGFNTKDTNFKGRQQILLPESVRPVSAIGETSNKYVVSLNQEAINFIPVSIGQWVIDQHGVVPDYWKIVGAPKLASTISSEVLLLNDQLSLVFKGDRRVKLTLDLNNIILLKGIFTAVNTIAVWIYSEGKDIETRHHIFNNQVCQLSLTEIEHFADNFNSIADRVLENSILSYRYYVQNTNKELSKSLTEINKTLFEHINKIRQNTMDLVNGLWRDFTTAFGLMVLNFSLKKPDVSGTYWSLLLLGLMAYLAISYYLSSSVGFWFYYRLKTSLTDMRVRIYAYLSDDDFNDLAILPLKSAQKKFISTFWIVLICYLAIIVLVFFALRIRDISVLNSIFKFV